MANIEDYILWRWKLYIIMAHFKHIFKFIILNI